jgi:NADH-quinone oxidoreductase subunit H
MFFLGEYTAVITTSFITVIVFFGGWHFPWIAEPGSPWWLRFIVFIAKMTFFIFFFMWVRWTLPRFRFDQLMGLAWKVLIPLALLNLVCVMVVLELDWSRWWLLLTSLVLLLGAGWVGTLMPTPKRVLPSTV